ncbi:MAG: FMN-binding glutamate synthase family protein [Gammaproteobacteria bacterium]|nr:FMN-binding glutamate synthase family protein [Gammaproteobacteria bacterium]MBK81107.1 FMN-binding glutamate synthase family protein [Gammaproteobacteria bacterium]|tara:strand:+ start:1602 stop:3242 length:1641 start_codon:yes stop_codon:yes gene_type:complete
MVRRWLLKAFVVTLAAVAVAAWFAPAALWSLAVILPVAAVGFHDALQKQHTVLRNFPIVGHIRYVMERFRPEIQQYFIESNIDAYPVEREMRAIVYQRAKGELETRPFGTQRDVFQVGYEWASHSMAAHHGPAEPPRVTIGGERCSQPYSASLLNISAMSFGALSHRAIEALNRGAAMGGFAHNTGEGGIADQHLLGGDVIWQIGTGYFGCRTEDGRFDSDAFAQQSRQDAVKMVELKLSQGAKPGHGGVLPGVKVTDEIARIRMLEPGKTVISPPSHAEFDTPEGLLEFVDRLRTLSGGKPVGFKLCVGRRTDFFAICKAMLETGITPDFITVDGGEGGTGAAPLEFSNSVGMPARDAWVFVHNALTGIDKRRDVKIVASGKIITGFHMIRALAIGADLCASARGMMFALGCIQSLRCNANTCPTGITTQDPALTYGLDPNDKSVRVANFHKHTIKGFGELLGAMGLDDPSELRPEHIYRRVDGLLVRNMSELYEYLAPGQLLDEDRLPEGLRAEWRQARPDRWTLAPEGGQYGGAKLREDSEVA